MTCCESGPGRSATFVHFLDYIEEKRVLLFIPALHKVTYQDVEEINLPVGNYLESRVLDLVNVVKELAAAEIEV